MDRIQYLKGLVNESIDETLSGFDTFKDFQKLSKRHGELHKNNFSDVKPNEDGQNGLMVYHCTGSNCYSREDYMKIINSFKRTGIVGSREWLGENGQCYGRGVYCMLKYGSVRTEYGPICIHFLIKPETVNNHFIFTSDEAKSIAIKRGALLSKYANETSRVQLKRVLGDNVYKKLLHKKNYNETEDDFCKRVLYSLERNGGSGILNDSLMDEAGVEGYTFDYGDIAVMIRMFDCATAVRYTFVSSRYGRNSNNGIPDGELLDNEESFEQQNFFTDVYHRHRNSYPLTNKYETVRAGLTKVSRYLTDDNGRQLTYNGKNVVVTNFVNGMTGEMLFVTPLPLGDNANVNIVSNSLQFKLGNKTFKIMPNLKEREIIYLIQANSGLFKKIDKVVFDNYSLAYMQAFVNQLKKPINENYMDGDFNDFQNLLKNGVTFDDRRLNKQEFHDFGKKVNNGNRIFVYTCSDADPMSFMRNSASPEWTGSSGDASVWQGICMYGALSLSAAMKNHNGGYGRYCMKFLLNDDINKYLIFEPELRRVLQPNLPSLPEQIRQMCRGKKTNDGKDLESVVVKAINSISHNGSTGHFENLGTQLHHTHGHFPHDIYDRLKGNGMGMINKAHSFEEDIFNRMGLHGWIYNGGNHHDCICVRNFSALMPVGYIDLNGAYGGNWPKNSDGTIRWIKNPEMEETFNRLNPTVSPRFQYGAEYANTPYIQKSYKQMFGMCPVLGSQGVNIMDTKTHRHILFTDAEEFLTGINPNSQVIKFVLLGRECSLQKIAEGKFIFIFDGKKLTRPKSLYSKIIQMQGAGKLKGKKLYDDSLLLDPMNNEGDGLNEAVNMASLGGNAKGANAFSRGNLSVNIGSLIEDNTKIKMEYNQGVFANDEVNNFFVKLASALNGAEIKYTAKAQGQLVDKVIASENAPDFAFNIIKAIFDDNHGFSNTSIFDGADTIAYVNPKGVETKNSWATIVGLVLGYKGAIFTDAEARVYAATKLFGKEGVIEKIGGSKGGMFGGNRVTYITAFDFETEDGVDASTLVNNNKYYQMISEITKKDVEARVSNNTGNKILNIANGNNEHYDEIFTKKNDEYTKRFESDFALDNSNETAALNCSIIEYINKISTQFQKKNDGYYHLMFDGTNVYAPATGKDKITNALKYVFTKIGDKKQGYHETSIDGVTMTYITVDRKKADKVCF